MVLKVHLCRLYLFRAITQGERSSAQDVSLAQKIPDFIKQRVSLVLKFSFSSAVPVFFMVAKMSDLEFEEDDEVLSGISSPSYHASLFSMNDDLPSTSATATAETGER